jgi:hypothetical protein
LGVSARTSAPLPPLTVAFVCFTICLSNVAAFLKRSQAIPV